MISLPADVADEIVRRVRDTDGGLLALNQIGADFGLLGYEVDRLVTDRTRQQAVAAALPPAADVPTVPAPAVRRQSRTTLSADQLAENPANIRDTLGDLRGLVASLRQHGMLQPLVVTEHADGFLIIDGHRRFAAGRIAGMTRYSCVIRHGVVDVDDQVVLMLVANCQRVDVDPIERAQAFDRLVSGGLSQTEVARRCGVHESTVSDGLALLALDDETLDAVKGGRVSVYDALKVIRDVRRAARKASGTPQRGRKPQNRQALPVTEQQAAALNRLLDWYLAERPGTPLDPGVDDLETLRKRVGRLRQDHSAYSETVDHIGAGATAHPGGTSE